MAQLQATGVTGSLTTTGDIAVDGGNITTTAALLNVSSSQKVRINSDVFVIDNNLFVRGPSALMLDRRGAVSGGICFGSSSLPLTNPYAGAGTLTIEGVINSNTSSFQMHSIDKVLYLSAQPSLLLDNPIPAITQYHKFPYPIGIGTIYQTGFDVYVSGSNIALDGDVVIPSGRSIQLTSSNISFTSGNGIDFSAGSNAAGMTSELLNDYEEGTWTPALSGSTSGGSYSYAVGTGLNQGHYVKIGSLVHLVGYISASATTPLTGNVYITGLPFVSSGAERDRVFGGAVGQWRGFSTSVVNLVPESVPGASFIRFMKFTAATTANTSVRLVGTDLSTNNILIRFSHFYYSV